MPPNFERGFSDQYKSENTLGQYAFGYNEDHTSGGSFRRETGDQFGNKIGSYGLRVADGRIRIVNYVADHNGYRADMVSNEPGLSSQKYSGFFGINKKSLLGVTIPGMRYAAEAPYLTFDDDHQQPPTEMMQTEPVTMMSPSVQHSAEAFEIDHQQVPSEMEHAGPVQSFEGTVEQKMVPEDESFYDQANTISDAPVKNGDLYLGDMDFETSATETKTDQVTEATSVSKDSQHISESRTVETAVKAASNDTKTDVKDESSQKSA
ncbi:cuticle protein 14 isoform b [Trichonephila inaurata madagascariensis]|uniref:Cuticle protein 14 isoform b n=1 Tax=Trichonephila inaurata madagascariensis TaxID=2747483 RepID=A0A8X6X968_9ARAC|nr:cuticle protein 14 isoform b [Trichonephila inaurata madagascariensis]